MWNKEEVKLAVDDLRLLDEALIDVGSLGWVLDEVLTAVVGGLLEETLANTLVHDDQGDFRRLFLGRGEVFGFCQAVLERDDVLELLELLLDDLLAHGIADAVTVDKQMLGHFAVEFLVAGKRALEVI